MIRFLNTGKLAARIFLVSFLVLIHTIIYAENNNAFVLSDTSCICTDFQISCTRESGGQLRPNPILLLFKAKQKKNKKIIAAILAFPFPFGIVGLHRIYLGTAPHVPVVYIGTIGGVFGILPFIDFCVLVLDKNIDRFIENKKVLMWVDENKKADK